jgi:undecaprenyl-diphosphatase
VSVRVPSGLLLAAAAPPLAPGQPATATAATTESTTPTPAADHLNYPTAAILGVVEGLTEYLPVSSTGHLIVANRLLGLDADTPALSRDGLPLFRKEKEPLPIRVLQKLSGDPAAAPQLVPFTLKNAADAYIIVIQFGAILAVLFVYWARVSGLLLGLAAREKDSLLLARNLLLAFLPAAALGFVFNSLIEEILFGVAPVVFALFAGAIAMLAVEHWYRAKLAAARAHGASHRHHGPDLHQLTPTNALTIGVAQCLALWPGTSRSMATICGGYLAGLSPARATEFSFLLGLITLASASLYKTASSGANMAAAFHIGPLLLGLIVATITSFFAVKWMVRWINRHGLALFAWYRIALSIVLFVLFCL